MKAWKGSLIAAWTIVMVSGVPAAAAVPTVADFAACNMKAAQSAASDAASASPKTDLPRDATRLPPDVKRHDGPRGDVPAVPPTEGKAGVSITKDPTGSTLSSDKDPQIEGMAADRVNDPVYVAAYRSCMRQRGF